MSTKANDAIPEPGEAERTAQAIGALRRRSLAGEDIPPEDFDRLLDDLANSDCQSEGDALALLALSRLFTTSAIENLPPLPDFVLARIQEADLYQLMVMHYLEQRTGLKAADFSPSAEPPTTQ